MKNFTYKNPASVEEAVSFLMEPGTVAMGGGTDLLGVLKDGLLPEYPGQVVNLKNIPGLNRIEEQEDDGEPFEEKMGRLTSELSELFQKSHELEKNVRQQLYEIGYKI